MKPLSKLAVLPFWLYNTHNANTDCKKHTSRCVHRYTHTHTHTHTHTDTHTHSLSSKEAWGGKRPSHERPAGLETCRGWGEREREREGKTGGVREKKGWSRGVRKENKEEGEDTGAGEEDRVRPCGERVAAGQISVTPKSSLLKGWRGGERGEGSRAKGELPVARIPFFFFFFSRGQHQYTSTQMYRQHTYMRASPHTQSSPLPALMHMHTH